MASEDSVLNVKDMLEDLMTEGMSRQEALAAIKEEVAKRREVLDSRMRKSAKPRAKDNAGFNGTANINNFFFQDAKKLSA